MNLYLSFVGLLVIGIIVAAVVRRLRRRKQHGWLTIRGQRVRFVPVNGQVLHILDEMREPPRNGDVFVVEELVPVQVERRESDAP